MNKIKYLIVLSFIASMQFASDELSHKKVRVVSPLSPFSNLVVGVDPFQIQSQIKKPNVFTLKLITPDELERNGGTYDHCESRYLTPLEIAVMRDDHYWIQDIVYNAIMSQKKLEIVRSLNRSKEVEGNKGSQRLSPVFKYLIQSGIKDCNN